MLFRNFNTGKSHSFKRNMWRRARPGEIQVTVALKPVSCGTELNSVQEGLPDAIPVAACYLGWQDSLRHREARRARINQ